MMADTAVAVEPEGRALRRPGRQVLATLPLVGRRLPIIADEHVDIDFGTGALKITPGHDVNDFEIGRKHGLEEISVIGEDGLMTEQAGEAFAGMTVAEAQVVVAEALRKEGVLSAEEEYVHSVPFSERPANASSRSSRCSGSAGWTSWPLPRSPRLKTAA